MKPPAPVTAACAPRNAVQSASRRRLILAAPCGGPARHRRRRARLLGHRGSLRARSARSLAAAVPCPCCAAACASRRRSRSRRPPRRPFALAVLLPRTKARDVASSRSRCGPSRSFTSCHTTTPSGCGGGFKIRYPIRVDRALGGGELPTARLQRAFSRTDGSSALGPRARDRPLGLVRRAAPGAALDPRARRGALPARRPADGGRVRPRLRDLLRRPDGAAVVGGRARLHGRARSGGSWSRSASRPGAAPGRRCTSRSAATRGRRCRPCTSRPRLLAAILLSETGRAPARPAGATR